MPKPTAKRGFYCPPEDCHVSRHLTAPEFKVYNVMVAFAVNGRKSRGGEGPLLFTASVVPTLCNALNYSSRSPVDKILAGLYEAGWIIWRGRERRADGTEKPNAWEMLEHEAFVENHPDSCPEYPFCPDKEAGEQFGVRRGEKLVKESLPRNFALDRSLPDAIFSEEPSLLTEEDWQSVCSYMRKTDHSRKRGTGTTPVNAELGEDEPLPQTRQWTAPVNAEAPLPHLGSDHSRKQGPTTPAVTGGNLIPAIPKTANYKTATTTTTTTKDDGANPAPSSVEPPSWLLWLWSYSFADEEPRILKHRQGQKREDDLLRLNTLIKDHGNDVVAVAWVMYANDKNFNKETQFVVWGFLENASSYLDAAHSDVRQFNENRKLGINKRGETEMSEAVRAVFQFKSEKPTTQSM